MSDRTPQNATPRLRHRRQGTGPQGIRARAGVLQAESVRVQEWVVSEGIKVQIVFEGRDGDGKGGPIKRITERVSPRVFRVVALPAPSDRERSQVHIQRMARGL